MNKKGRLIFTLAFALAGASAAPASAAYPTKPVEMTITFKAGGAADISGRTVAKAAEKTFGQPIVAVNRPGAGGTIGFAYVKTAPATGYKIGWLSASILTGTNMGRLPYDYRAWDYVSRVVFEATAIVVRGDSPYKTLPDLVKAAKSKTLKIGSAGSGSFTRLTASALSKKAGFKFRHVPLGKRRVPSLLGGEVDAISVHPPEVLALHKAGKVRMLAVSFPKRHPAYPNVPLFSEHGWDVGFYQFRGIHVPKGTPAEAVQKLHKAFEAASRDPKVLATAEKRGFLVSYLGPDKFPAFVAKQNALIRNIVVSLGLDKKKKKK